MRTSFLTSGRVRVHISVREPACAESASTATDAQDCYYFSPGAAVNEPLCYSCMKEFDEVTRFCCEVVLDSRVSAVADGETGRG